MQIRTLTASDAGRYRELMLEAYTLAPDAFTSTAEEEERAREPCGKARWRMQPSAKGWVSSR